MNRAPFKFLTFLAAASCFFQALAEGPTYGSVRPTPRSLEVPEPGKPLPVPGFRAPKLAGSAQVEVWGDTRQERMRLFSLDLAPSLSQAYTAGYNHSATSQQLGEFMTMTAVDVRPPSVPSVFYNSFRKVEDPDLARDGIHVGVTGKSGVTFGAGARQR